MIYLDPLSQFTFWLLSFIAQHVIIPLLALDPLMFCIGLGGVAAILMVYVCAK